MTPPSRRQEVAAPSNTAMRMFQNKDRTGNELLDSSLPTTHQNQVGWSRIPSSRQYVRSGHLLLYYFFFSWLIFTLKVLLTFPTFSRSWSSESSPETRRKLPQSPPGVFLHLLFLLLFILLLLFLILFLLLLLIPKRPPQCWWRSSLCVGSPELCTEDGGPQDLVQGMEDLKI